MQTQPNINTPHSTKKKWQIWWQLTRPHTLTAAFVPVLLGSALAIYETSLDAGLFIAMMVASLFLQIATNMFNEYYDFKRGNDTAESVGIGGAIVREGIKPHVVLNSALGLYGASILIGIYICMNSSWWLAAVGLLGMAIGYLYTGGPLPIAYTPFGEIISGFVMGMLLILISFFIQTGTVTTTSVLVAIPSLLLVGGIMLSNNIRDLDGDKEFGRKTLAILIGRPKAVKLLATMFIVSYIWVFILIVMQVVSPWLALVVLSAPKPINAIKGFKGKTIAYEMVPAMKNTAQTNTVFGLLLSIGLLIGYIL
ncbi:1,4-dihydroxy-2-naphthoate polyprenyltransferase [Cytobacillus sp. FSL W7-1323]|uniref:1,4-dihydroxy-2-naphthoate octaprenyltransferase n=1 Tax=Cytobacillus kochii TaxID=859143 RepID=A0A248TKF3_9BACI|nr:MULTISPECIES: 1,4-dihydroxy-2-naphthoate polyprenyltransferase [Cytobacillus]ASV68570.1 1,4-dihydroxy-2-naphthoate octaprenyltransferase [Cytobacillus kochii]MDQ0186100.1 1,4-dihydroxy-2-naphthoate octaprenyltransferase [Cytobacillus kochii]MEA1855200.1 1,4-dihydroxy-2-naphthoate polyprenyltransferase [Cytobacillus sp. OWB-43]MED1605967.1 1,4-dihydroxy-2-naphthoate polyprenyltransferase [Cytobacillus kochii]